MEESQESWHQGHQPTTPVGQGLYQSTHPTPHTPPHPLQKMKTSFIILPATCQQSAVLGHFCFFFHSCDRRRYDWFHRVCRLFCNEAAWMLISPVGLLTMGHSLIGVALTKGQPWYWVARETVHMLIHRSQSAICNPFEGAWACDQSSCAMFAFYLSVPAYFKAVFGTQRWVTEPFWVCCSL